MVVVATTIKLFFVSIKFLSQSIYDAASNYKIVLKKRMSLRNIICPDKAKEVGVGHVIKLFVWIFNFGECFLGTFLL